MLQLCNLAQFHGLLALSGYVSLSKGQTHTFLFKLPFRLPPSIVSAALNFSSRFTRKYSAFATTMQQPVSSLTAGEKLSKLRDLMRQHGLAAYYVPSEDAHQVQLSMRCHLPKDIVPLTRNFYGSHSLPCILSVLRHVLERVYCCKGRQKGFY
jgi:hypothetical protein